MSGGTAAVQGIAMLNPQKWVTGGGVSASSASGSGYKRGVGLESEEDTGGSALYIGEEDMEDDDEDGLVMETAVAPPVRPGMHLPHRSSFRKDAKKRTQ